MSVVICAPTERRWQELLAAIASVQRQTLPALEIIVVVDQDPALLERVTTQIPAVLAVANVDAPGLAGSYNSALAMARGTFVALIDDVAVPAPDWLESLYAQYLAPPVP